MVGTKRKAASKIEDVGMEDDVERIDEVGRAAFKDEEEERREDEYTSLLPRGTEVVQSASCL